MTDFASGWIDKKIYTHHMQFKSFAELWNFVVGDLNFETKSPTYKGFDQLPPESQIIFSFAIKRITTIFESLTEDADIDEFRANVISQIRYDIRTCISYLRSDDKSTTFKKEIEKHLKDIVKLYYNLEEL